MTHYLVIIHNDAGDILSASLQDVLNADTWQTDGYLVYSDGRSHGVEPNTRLYATDWPYVSDLIAWRTDGKYYVDTADGTLYETDGWTPPDTSPSGG